MTATRKFLLSAFIVFNLLTMIRVHLPLQNKFFAGLYRPIDAYLSFFSIYQDWYMFAPNPSKTSFHLTADVEFDDGSKDTYEFPKQSELNFFQRYTYGERYRKIISESIRKDEYSYMWPDTAKFILRKMKDKHYQKMPSKVHLTRHWDDIPDVNMEFRPHLSKSNEYKSYKFYTYEVY